MPIPVIDLFAGPGGLGEGFSSLHENGGRIYQIRLSIEKDPVAHQTLLLRSFFRQFNAGKAPKDYYKYLRTGTGFDELFAAHKRQAYKAVYEAWNTELGCEKNARVDKRIRTALGRQKTNWVLIGGPPCQAYSVAGRVKMQNSEGFKHDDRHFLYREYLRIVAKHQPAVFVMENVKGIISSRVSGERIFPRILRDLQDPVRAIRTNVRKRVRYRLVSLVEGRVWRELNSEPSSFLVRSEQHGIPQARHRVFVVGIREDVKGDPIQLQKSRGRPRGVAGVIRDLPKLRSGLSRETDGIVEWLDAIKKIRKESWYRQLSPRLKKQIKEQISELPRKLDRGMEFFHHARKGPVFGDGWFHDPRLNGVCNHSTRSHIISDIHRYFFASAFAFCNNRSPVLDNFPADLLPNHENCKTGKFPDRFRVQLGNKPSTTITSHISRDGHYYIHHDPRQCRSLTVREAARLQTFPDNYLFRGGRTQQYHQVGNAVPPFLARQIAECLLPLFETR